MKRLVVAIGFSLGVGLLASSASAQEVIVREPRPAAMREGRRPPPPSHEAVWVPGYQHWNGSAWGWNAGHWEVPEHHGARWVAPMYRRGHDGQGHYVPGHWR